MPRIHDKRQARYGIHRYLGIGLPPLLPRTNLLWTIYPGAEVNVAEIVISTFLFIAGQLRLRSKLLAVNLTLVLGALASTGKTPGHDPADRSYRDTDATLDREGTCFLAPHSCLEMMLEILA